MIEVENLVKCYGKHMAVDHLNFTIEPGHIYGFLGPNGAGKSTTMNIMTGYIGATEGTVKINGHDILQEPERAKRTIGYLPEIPPLYMEMTVYEYLTFAARLKRIPKKEVDDQVIEVMRLVKIEDMADRLIQNLSKGYKQRVGLAQAVLGYPEIIILDEPTVGLDPNQIIEIRALIRKLSKDHTIILSSHILAEVQEVCDYIMIISGGKLVASDTTENLEKTIGKEGYIRIQCRASEQDADKALKTILMIDKYQVKEKKNGVLTIDIQAKEAEDIREQIFFAFAEKKIPLLTLTRKDSTLEEVFLALTMEEEETNDRDL